MISRLSISSHFVREAQSSVAFSSSFSLSDCTTLPTHPADTSSAPSAIVRWKTWGGCSGREVVEEGTVGAALDLREIVRIFGEYAENGGGRGMKVLQLGYV